MCILVLYRAKPLTTSCHLPLYILWSCAASNHPSEDGLKLHHDVQGWAGCVLIPKDQDYVASLLMKKYQTYQKTNCGRSCNKKQNQPWRGRPPCLPALQHREPPWPEVWRCKAREMKCDLESLPWQHAFFCSSVSGFLVYCSLTMIRTCFGLQSGTIQK